MPTLSRLDSILVDDAKGRPLVELGLLVTCKRLVDTIVVSSIILPKQTGLGRLTKVWNDLSHPWFACPRSPDRLTVILTAAGMADMVELVRV